MLIYTAIGVGLLGSLHCLGMCAPITWVVNSSSSKKWKWLGGRLVYNTGRLITYAILGVLAGLLGTTLSMAGWQQGLSIAAGVLILGGILFFGMEIPDKALLKPLNRFIQWIKKRIGRLLAKRGVGAQLALGMLNGLLPCGLVYAALIAAVSMGTIGGAALYMVLFGLGTFPMMLAAAFFGKIISVNFKQKVWKLAPKMIALVGILFILRGMNLGIPFVSPKLMSATEIAICRGNSEVIEYVELIENKFP